MLVPFAGFGNAVIILQYNLYSNSLSVENNSLTPRISKYQLGYSECASEVSEYLAKVDEVGTDLRSRLLNHLTDINMSSHKDTESIDYDGLVSSRNSSPIQMIECPHVDALLNHDRNHTGTTLYTPPGNRVTCKTNEANKKMVEETSCTVVNNMEHNDVISGLVTSGDVAYLIPATSLFQFGNVPYPSSNVVIRVLQPMNITNSTGTYVSPDLGTKNSPNIAIEKESKTIERVLPTDQSFHSPSPTPMDDVTKEDVVSDDSRPFRYLSLPLQLPSSCNQLSQNDVIKDCNYLHNKRDTSKHQNQMWRPW